MMRPILISSLISVSLLPSLGVAARPTKLLTVENTVLQGDEVTYAEAAPTKAKRARKPASVAPVRRVVVRRSDDDAERRRTALELAKDLGISDDDNRPEKQRALKLFGKSLILGGELSASMRGRRHYDLVRDANDDDIQIDPVLKLEAIWLPSNSVVAFASGRALMETDLYKQGGGASGQGGVALDNLWLLKIRLFDTPLAIQVGRQRFRERREWWWDSNFDAVRLHYFGSKVTAYAGIGRPVANFSTLGRREPEDRGLVRSFGNVAWEWSKSQHIELFALKQLDKSRRYAVGDIIPRNRADTRDANLTWVGARARGCAKMKHVRRICYWGDIAKVRGKEVEYDLDRVGVARQIVDQLDRRRVRGWAYDAGVSVELPFKFKPILTLGHARGSGDRSGTPGRDGAFRQTGLHQNDGKFRGLNRFRVYGEVLRPDLSNIAITTAALGLPLGDDKWIETVWHRYRQPVADNRIAGSRLGSDPTGNSRKLGSEIDIIMAHRPSAGWEVELTAGAFRAGSAFGNETRRWASLVEIKVDYNF